MNTWIDNLLALLIGGVVVLILVSQQRTAQELSVDSTLSYMSKTQMLDMASWMTEDINNLGSGVSESTPALEAPTYNASGLTTAFAFRRRMSRSEAAAAGTPADTVAAKRFVYALRAATTVSLKGVSTPLFQLVRCQAETGLCPTSTPAASAARLTDFRVDVLDLNGTATTSAAAVRLIRFRVASVVPEAERRSSTYLERTYWGTTLPVMQAPTGP